MLNKDDKYSTTFYTTKKMKIDALKVAKRKGINTLNGLLNFLIADFIEKNREILEKQK